MSNLRTIATISYVTIFGFYSNNARTIATISYLIILSRI